MVRCVVLFANNVHEDCSYIKKRRYNTWNLLEFWQTGEKTWHLKFQLQENLAWVRTLASSSWDPLRGHNHCLWLDVHNLTLCMQSWKFTDAPCFLLLVNKLRKHRCDMWSFSVTYLLTKCSDKSRSDLALWNSLARSVESNQKGKGVKWSVKISGREVLILASSVMITLISSLPSLRHVYMNNADYMLNCVTHSNVMSPQRGTPCSLFLQDGKPQVFGELMAWQTSTWQIGMM